MDKVCFGGGGSGGAGGAGQNIWCSINKVPGPGGGGRGGRNQQVD